MWGCVLLLAGGRSHQNLQLHFVPPTFSERCCAGVRSKVTLYVCDPDGPEPALIFYRSADELWFWSLQVSGPFTFSPGPKEPVTPTTPDHDLRSPESALYGCQ